MHLTEMQTQLPHRMHQQVALTVGQMPPLQARPTPGQMTVNLYCTLWYKKQPINLILIDMTF